MEHPHIVKYYDFYEDELNLYIVTEFTTGYELLSFFVQNCNGGVKEQVALRLLQ
jgi:serine/threonine protein kinase